MINFITSETGIALAVGLVGILWGIVRKLDAIKKYNLEKGLEFIEAGVKTTYDEFVRAAKAESGDGKLSEENRTAAVNSAINTARQYAANNGIDLFKSYAEEYLPVLVDKAVAAAKNMSK